MARKKKREGIEVKKYTKKEIEKIMKEVEENPYFKLFQKDSVPRCMVCGEKYKNFKPYLWRSNCPHIPKNLILAVG